MRQKGQINGIIFVVIFVVIVFAVGAFLFLNNQRNESVPTPAPTSTLNPSPTPTALPVPEEWESIEKENFTISYPPEADVSQVNENITSLTILGPSQQQGTEITSGMKLTFISGEYSEDAFLDFVENEHTNTKNQTVTQSVSDITTAFVAEYEGYKFDVVSLGESTQIYLPQNSHRYLQISKLVADPNNQGFIDLSEQIMSTLNLH